MNIKSMDLKICLDKAKEMLDDKNVIKNELDSKGKASCHVETENYRLDINIKAKEEE